MKDIKCSMCANTIYPKRAGSYYEVVGWVERRKEGGANQVRNKQPTGRWAHHACLEGEKYDAQQMTMEDFLE